MPYGSLDTHLRAHGVPRRRRQQVETANQQIVTPSPPVAARGPAVTPVGRAASALTSRTQARASLNAALSGLTPAQQSLAPFAISAARETGVPASVLLALSGQESNYGQNQGPSSEGARGETQFIPSTRASFIQKYGVDAWAGPKQAFKATGLYLKELGFDKNPQQALSGYSGGYAQGAYNDPILTNAQNFRGLDKLAGSGGKIPGAGRAPASVAELFYDPGISLKDGQQIGSIGGHGTHVHVGSDDPRAEKRFINIARKRFGLNVGENVFVGDPPAPGVHVSGSYHYREAKLPSGRKIDLGADVTGSPQAMAAYDQFIAKKFGDNPQAVAGGYGAPAVNGGFSAGFGGSVPIGSSDGRTTAPITMPGPPAYSPSDRTGIAAAPAKATDLATVQGTLAAILGGGGQAPADQSVLAQILRRQRFRPRR